MAPPSLLPPDERPGPGAPRRRWLERWLDRLLERIADLASGGRASLARLRAEATERRLDLAEGRLRTLFSSSADALLLCDDAGRIVAAHQDGKVLGISHHDGERVGPIGVAASARGRGLGHLLMFATLGNQKRAGLRCAWFLWSDDRTAARLYHAGGFKEIRRFVVMRKGHA